MSKQEKLSGRVVFYLSRQQLSLYDPVQNQVFGYEFPKEIVSDLTVLNESEYKKLLARALAQYKVSSQKSLVVLARDMYFIKPIEEIKPVDGTAAKSPTEQLREWRDAAPFTNVYARIMKQQSGSVALAASRDFFEPLLNSLAGLKYEVTLLVPEFVVPVDLSQGLTVENGTVLSNQADKLTEFNFLESTQKAQAFTITSTTPEEKKRTWILAAVFALLLAVLGVVYWYVNIFSAPPLPSAPVVPVPMSGPTVPPVLEDPSLASESGAPNSPVGSETLLPQEEVSTASASAVNSTNLQPDSTASVSGQ